VPGAKRGDGLEILHGRAAALLAFDKPNDAIQDLDRLTSIRPGFGPAKMLRADARERLGQFDQAARDCLLASRAMVQSKDNTEYFERLQSTVAMGQHFVRETLADAGERERVFEVTGEGIARRREIDLADLLQDGSSRKREAIAMIKKTRELLEKDRLDYEAGRILDIDSAKQKRERARATAEKSRTARLERRRQEEAELKARREAEARRKEEEKKQKETDMQLMEAELMAAEEASQRTSEAKAAAKAAEAAAAEAEDEAELAELLASRRGRSRQRER